MESVLVLAGHQSRQIAEHAEATYPEECCGILIGRRNAVRKEVRRIVPAANSHAGERDERYSIAPEALLLAHKGARAEGLEVIGYYHSHPDHPAVPSGSDAHHAWLETSYLIVAVLGGRSAEQRSWRLAADGAFAEEDVVVEEGAGAW